jgi:hypothetical protein
MILLQDNDEEFDQLVEEVTAHLLKMEKVMRYVLDRVIQIPETGAYLSRHFFNRDFIRYQLYTRKLYLKQMYIRKQSEIEKVMNRPSESTDD